MRRLLTWSLWLVAGALVINLGSLLLPHFHSVRGSLPSVVPTRAEPHTVVVEEVHPQSRNPGRVVARYTTVVRSDGSRVREMLAFQDDSTTPSSWVRELRLASGRTIDIDYLHGMRTTQQTNDPFLNEAPLEPKQRCLSSARGGAMVSGEFLGEGLVHGFRVFKLRHGSATSWHAPGLGCATLVRAENNGVASPARWRLYQLSGGSPTVPGSPCRIVSRRCPLRRFCILTPARPRQGHSTQSTFAIGQV